MTYRVEVEREASRELRKLDPPVRKRILSFLQDRIANLDDPRDIGEALQGSRLGDLWKYRVGDWRITVDIHDDVLLVLVVRIGHRSTVYRER